MKITLIMKKVDLSYVIFKFGSSLRQHVEKNGSII